MSVCSPGIVRINAEAGKSVPDGLRHPILPGRRSRLEKITESCGYPPPDHVVKALTTSGNESRRLASQRARLTDQPAGVPMILRRATSSGRVFRCVHTEAVG